MFLFRCDMNSTIATGHVMRCLSIADAARDEGIESVFITADDCASELLNNRGYRQVVLNTYWDDFDSEIETVVPVIEELAGDRDKLIVDSYSVTDNYLRAVREHIYTAYIDDYGTRAYPVDCLICYAIYAEDLGLEKMYDSSVKLLLGTDYVPLRKEFRNIPKRQIAKECKNLLILSGGSDPYSVIKGVLERLDTASLDNIYAVCGVYNKDYDYLMDRYGDSAVVQIIQSTPNIIDYMLRADLAISAAGSTLYELCATGTPTISYTYADNQLMNARGFDKRGIIPYAGDAREVGTIGVIVDIVENMLAADACERSRLMRECVKSDGGGKTVRAI